MHAEDSSVRNDFVADRMLIEESPRLESSNGT